LVLKSVIVSLVLLAGLVSRAFGDEFLAGADFSHLAFFEDRGTLYKDGGQTMDGLAILKSNGVNCVRLRIFTSSAAQAQADPYNYTNNLAYDLPLAVRVKNAGLQFLLDFHYSDTWADPSHQSVPLAWTNMTLSQLEVQMRAYNSNCIAAFIGVGAAPDYVQIGNEITQGMLWPVGYVSGNSNTAWSNLGNLMKAAVNGIKDAAGTNMPKIMIHIDRGGDWTNTEWFFDNVLNQQVPFDIIGESYYPFYHGPLSNLQNCLTNAAKRYNKPVMIAETAFPWTGTNNIYGIPGTTNGQVQYVVALAQIVKGIPGGKGAGIFWWGTEYQQLSGYNLAGFDQRSFFSSGFGAPLPTGNVLPVANAFGQLAAPTVMNATVSGSSVMLTWPLSGAGMSLTTSTSLTPDATWSAVGGSVQSTGTIFTVTQPLDDSQSRFYRLQAN
jgi:arabinogalactan endo-1,4-beta-galactosidase